VFIVRVSSISEVQRFRLGKSGTAACLQQQTADEPAKSLQRTV